MSYELLLFRLIILPEKHYKDTNHHQLCQCCQASSQDYLRHHFLVSSQHQRCQWERRVRRREPPPGTSAETLLAREEESRSMMVRGYLMGNINFNDHEGRAHLERKENLVLMENAVKKWITLILMKLTKSCIVILLIQWL